MSRKILVLANETATAQHYQRLLGAGGHDVQSDELGSAEVAAAVAGGIDVAFIILTAAELEPVDILHQLKAVDSTLRVVVVSRPGRRRSDAGRRRRLPPRAVFGRGITGGSAPAGTDAFRRHHDRVGRWRISRDAEL
jgi:hypothetical protein